MTAPDPTDVVGQAERLADAFDLDPEFVMVNPGDGTVDVPADTLARLLDRWALAPRDQVAQLHEDGTLQQVGWYCNEAIGHSDRNQLCSHGWPCGATYAVAVPPPGADEAGR